MPSILCDGLTRLEALQVGTLETRSTIECERLTSC